MKKTAVDTKKRSFLKLASMVGLGVFTISLIPKKAQAMVFGSTPLAGQVGIKDSANLSVNPATLEKQNELLAELEKKADVTEIQPISGTIVANNSAGAGINLATEDNLVLLRRMVKLMESQATVDRANCQRVTIDAWGENITGLIDTGTATGVQGLMILVDTTKYTTWIENKWAYYAVKITDGTGMGQIRLITGNTSTTLILQDAWGTQPDETSIYSIYDIAFNVSDFGVATGDQGLTTLTDTAKAWTDNMWTNYAVRIADNSGATQIRLILNNTATVLTLDKPWTFLPGVTQDLDSGVATGEQNFVSVTLTDISKTWDDNAWANYIAVITSGTGAGQTQIISSNTSTVITLQNPWTIQPDTTSTYSIRSMPADANDSGVATGEQIIGAIVDSSKTWTENIWANYAVKITSGTGAGQIRQILSNTATDLTLATDWITQPDTTSTYAIYLIPSSQSYVICAAPTVSTDLGTSASCPRVTFSNDSGPIIGFYAAQQRFGDISHKVYNDSIRSKITFT